MSGHDVCYAPREIAVGHFNQKEPRPDKSNKSMPASSRIISLRIWSFPFAEGVNLEACVVVFNLD